jgi:hypothetical protein
VKKLLFVLLFVVSLATIAACNGAQSQVVTGVVLTVDQPTAGQVDGFTLRTADGQVLTFTVGVVDQDEGAFPPQHLTEHMQTAEPVKVTYKVQDGKNVATKLQDADAAPASGAPAASTSASAPVASTSASAPAANASASAPAANASASAPAANASASAPAANASAGAPAANASAGASDGHDHTRAPGSSEAPAASN